MAELSRMTGAAGGTIFHHFRNKEDLFLNVLGDIKETILDTFGQYLREENFSSGMDLVEGAVSFYLQLAGQMQAQFLLLHRHFPYKMAETNPTCRSYLESIYDCLLDIFEKGIVMGQQDGSVARVPARQSAMILFSMVDGIARFNTYQIYNAGTLFNELIMTCRRMLGVTRVDAL
jgi:AcrR family transcriptional regulator